jgi:hypothetical protein
MVEVVVSGIRIGLKNAGISRQVPGRMLGGAVE